MWRCTKFSRLKMYEYGRFIDKGNFTIVCSQGDIGFISKSLWIIVYSLNNLKCKEFRTVLQLKCHFWCMWLEYFKKKICYFEVSKKTLMWHTHYVYVYAFFMCEKKCTYLMHLDRDEILTGNNNFQINKLKTKRIFKDFNSRKLI